MRQHLLRLHQEVGARLQDWPMSVRCFWPEDRKVGRFQRRAASFLLVVCKPQKAKPVVIQLLRLGSCFIHLLTPKGMELVECSMKSTPSRMMRGISGTTTKLRTFFHADLAMGETVLPMANQRMKVSAVLKGTKVWFDV